MSSNNRWNRVASQAGFTLIEVITAFTLLALMLAALLPAFSGGLRSIDASETRVHAVLLANSTADLVGSELPLEEGEYSGSAEGGFDWLVRIRPLESAREHQDDGVSAQIAMFVVEIAILREGEQQVTLKTLRTVPME